MLLGAALLTMGPVAAEASIGYSLRYEGPRDPEAVEPLLAARLVRVGNASHGYGYGYGYGYGEDPDSGYGSGNGYGYGYGYGHGKPPRDDGAGDPLRFGGLTAGHYRIDGFADLDLDHKASPEEPRGTAVDQDGSTTIRLAPGDAAHVDLIVREAASRVTGRVVSTAAGTPVAGASVTLIDRFGWTLRATTAMDGVFLVNDAPTGETYHLHYGFRVEAAGYETLETGLAHAVTRGSYDAGELALRPLGTPPDTTAPAVLGHAPEGGNVSENATVRLAFSEPMDRASVERALHVDPAIAGAFAWSGDAVELRPAAPLARNATYRVTIGAGATDLAGNGLAPHAWSFTTEPPAPPAPETPPATPPHVLSHAPVGDKVPPGKPIVIAFSEPMDRASVEAALAVSPPLAAPLKVWWEDDTLHVRGHRAMEHGTTYTVTLDGDVRDAQGDAMGADHAWSFTTAPGPKPPTPGQGHADPPPPAEAPTTGPSPPAAPPPGNENKGTTPGRSTDPVPPPGRGDVPAKETPGRGTGAESPTGHVKKEEQTAPASPPPAAKPPVAEKPAAETPGQKEPASKTPAARAPAAKTPPGATAPAKETPKVEPARKETPHGRSTDPVVPPGHAKEHDKDKAADAPRGASQENPGRGTGQEGPPGHAKMGPGHAKAPGGKVKGK